MSLSVLDFLRFVLVGFRRDVIPHADVSGGRAGAALSSQQTVSAQLTVPLPSSPTPVRFHEPDRHRTGPSHRDRKSGGPAAMTLNQNQSESGGVIINNSER